MFRLLAFSIAAALYAQDAGSVEGVVVDSVTGAGIAGATVRIAAFEAVTDAAGAFTISGLKPGIYVPFTVKETGFATALLPQLVRVSTSKEPVHLRLELKPLAALRGRVFGVDGKPASGVEVEYGAFSPTVRTDSDGAFAFDKLAPGSHALRAHPPAENLRSSETASGWRSFRRIFHRRRTGG